MHAEVPSRVSGTVKNRFGFIVQLFGYHEDLRTDAGRWESGAEVFGQDFVGGEMLGWRATEGVERCCGVRWDGGCVVEIAIVGDLGNDCVGSRREEIAIDLLSQFQGQIKETEGLWCC